MEAGETPAELGSSNNNKAVGDSHSRSSRSNSNSKAGGDKAVEVEMGGTSRSKADGDSHISLSSPSKAGGDRAVGTAVDGTSRRSRVMVDGETITAGDLHQL
jgi:hypothetical protein